MLKVISSYGVTAGGEALASSVASAMEGVLVSITLPIKINLYSYLFCR